MASAYLNVIINLLIDNAMKRRKNKIKQLVYYSRKQKYYYTCLSHHIRREIPKIKNYCDTISSYPDDIFATHFRMNRITFQKLLEKCAQINSWPANISMDTAFLITIWKLANKESFRGVADRFNISKSHAYKVVMSTCKFLCTNTKQFVRWPTNAELPQIVHKFDSLRGRKSFPFVIGCVDGTHIRILAPKEDHVSYYNRKGFHSMLLQAICDSDFRFLDVFFGWPGCHHDANMWHNSPIGKALVEKRLKLPFSYHLLGDSAYKLYPFLMVGFRDNGFLTTEQKIFNKSLSSTRVVIEQAFRILTSKFRILKDIELRKIADIKYIVMACAALHNHIIEYENVEIMEDDLSMLNENDYAGSEIGVTELDISEEAKLKRDEICRILSS